MDSNHDKGLQRALCYRYTTGHAFGEGNEAGAACKGKSAIKTRINPHQLLSSILAFSCRKSMTFSWMICW